MTEKPHLHAVSQLEIQYEPLSVLVFDTPLVNIGRALTNNYVIPHISISRQHCCFKQTNDSWVINDISSTGILLNNQPISKATDHPLKHNDIIRLDFNGIFMYNFINRSENCDNKPLPSCTHSDIVDWIQNPDHESNLNRNRDSSNVTRQLQTNEEKRVAVVNQKSFLQSKHAEDLLLLENTYQVQIQQLKGDSEAIKLQREELLMKIENEKEELKSKFKATTGLLEVSEYKNKCIASESEKKESEEKLTEDKDQLSNRIIEIETNMENFASKKRTHDEMQSGSTMNYSNFLKSELMCTICTEYFISAVTLGCSHTFCKDCITQWKKQSRDCPFCRETITSETDCRTIDSVVDKIFLNLDEAARKKRQDIIDERKVPPEKKRRAVNRRRAVTYRLRSRNVQALQRSDR